MYLYRQVIVIFLSLIYLSLIQFAYAELTASIDRHEIVLGDSVTLQIKSDRLQLPRPDLSALALDFEVSNVGQSTSMQITNGKKTSETTWNVTLTPKTVGQKKIPSLTIRGENTSPITLSVNPPDPNAKAIGDLLIEVVASKASAYIQEEIQLTVRLLFKVSLSSGELSQPQSDGLIFTQIGKDKQYKTQRGGEQYGVLEREYVMTAERSGTLTLSPIIFKGQLAGTKRDVFGTRRRGRAVSQASTITTFEIKPIPSDFTARPWLPAQSLSLTENWSQAKQYLVGEPITRTVELSVLGLSKAQIPELNFGVINEAKSYADKVDVQTKMINRQSLTKKSMTFVIIPNQAGKLEIPKYQLNWFNTQTGKAEVIQLPATSFEILPSSLALSSAEPIVAPTGNQKPDGLLPLAEQPVMNERPFWQWLSYGFGVLWLVTLGLLFKVYKGKQKPVAQVSKPENYQINKQVLMAELRSKEIKVVQNSLIKWWNQNNQPTVSNLSQMANWVEDTHLKSSLRHLESALYGHEHLNDNEDWYKVVTSGRLTTSQSVKKESGLPELY